MTEYGYMENGYLRSRFIEPITRNYLDEHGQPQTETISVETQIAQLSPEWKPVEPLDQERLESGGDGFIIVPQPYDAGDKISYHYIKKRDLKEIREKIQNLKDELTGSDYKIIKSYEAFMAGTEPPYDIVSLHEERQNLRDQINELEEEL